VVTSDLGSKVVLGGLLQRPEPAAISAFGLLPPTIKRRHSAGAWRDGLVLQTTAKLIWPGRSSG
jgi:hypothetical protein